MILARQVLKKFLMETAHIYHWTSQRIPSFCENLKSASRLEPTDNRGKIDNLYIDLSELILFALKKGKYTKMTELVNVVVKKFNEAFEVV